MIGRSACVRICDDDNPGTNVYKSVNNSGVSTIKGWELSVLGKVADTYDVTASATSLKGFNSKGEELIRRPSQILTLNVGREFTYSGKSGSMNVNIQHIGNQLDWKSDYSGYQDLPKYTLVNLGATLNLNSNLELTGKLDNLFDEEYSEVRGYNKPGRTIYVGLQYTF